MSEIISDKMLAAMLRRKLTRILGKKLILEDISTAQFIEKVNYKDVGPNDLVYMGDFKGKYFTYRIKHSIEPYAISRTTLMQYTFHNNLPPNSLCTMYVKIMDDDMHGHILIKNHMGKDLPDAMYTRVKDKIDFLLSGEPLSAKTLNAFEKLYVPSFIGEYIDKPSQVLPRMTSKYRVCFSSQCKNDGLHESRYDPHIRDIGNIFETRDIANEFLTTNIPDLVEVIQNEESWLFNMKLLGYSADDIQKIIYYLGYNRSQYECDSTFALFRDQYFIIGQTYLNQHGIE